MSELRINNPTHFSLTIGVVKNDEARIKVSHDTGYTAMSINKQQAIQIIEHLKNQFQL